MSCTLPQAIGYVLAGAVIAFVVAVAVGYWLLSRMRRALQGGPRARFKA